MFNKAVDNYSHALEFVLDYYKTQKRCDKAVNTYSSTINMFMNAIRRKICMIKVVNKCFLYLILLPIDIKLKKSVKDLFTKIFLC